MVNMLSRRLIFSLSLQKHEAIVLARQGGMNFGGSAGNSGTCNQKESCTTQTAAKRCTIASLLITGPESFILNKFTHQLHYRICRFPRNKHFHQLHSSICRF